MSHFAQETVQAYSDALASNAPTPGGGSAAGVALSQGAALLCMVLNFTVGRKKYAAHEETLRPLLHQCDQVRTEALELAAQDMEAFEAVARCYGLPRQSDAEKAARKTAMETTLHRAAEVPSHILAHSHDLLRAALTIGRLGNRNVLSDVMVGAQLLSAAALSSEVNIRINMKYADASPARERMLSATTSRSEAIPEMLNEVLDVCRGRLKL